MPSANEQKEYLPTIDGWRAIAIGAVLLCHRQSELFGPAGLWPNPTLRHVLNEGSHGVDLFFAISGMLITRRLLQESRTTGRTSFGAFYLRRAFRILPAAAMYLSLISVVALAGKWTPSREELVASIFFFRNYVHGHVLTEHLWSLAVEEHFYLLWPLMFVVVQRWRPRLSVYPIVAVAFVVALGRAHYLAD